MQIVLYQPQIPQNTGNIARTCAATGTSLVLVRPLGFSTQNRHLKRAGLDYWDDVSVEQIDDLLPHLKGKPYFFFSSKATQLYTQACYPPDAVLIFGSETSGLPAHYREDFPENFFTIPMVEGNRCINLACSVAIVLYEALRQNHFLKMENKSEKIKLATREVVSGK